MPISIAYNESYEITMAKFPDKFFHLAVCDIPYGINVGNMAYLQEMGKKVKQKNGSKLNGNKKKESYTLKDWDKQPPPQSYFDELRRISHHQIIFGIDYVDWEGVGSGRIIWDKGVAEGVSFKSIETAYCSIIIGEITIPYLWSGMMQGKSLSEPMVMQGNKKLNEKRIHPTHKPVMLYDAIYKMFGTESRLIDWSAIIKPGDPMRVYDSHLGGGSHRISANKFEYDFYASEIDPEYYEKQETRYRNFTRQQKMF